MGYQPIYEAEFDLAVGEAEDYIDLLESVVRHKMMITGWLTHGPAGGNPMITLRGTRRQFIGWLDDYYDPDGNAVPRHENGVTLPDSTVWQSAKELFNFKFIA
jgi:hypothetical protein